MNESFLREAEALENYRRAYALTPNQPDLLIDYSGFSARTDRAEDAVRLTRQLREISPGYGHWAYGITLCWIGRCDDAIAPLYEAVSLEPDFHGAHVQIAMAEAIRGNDAIALQSLRVAENLWGDDFVAPLWLAHVLHTYGAIGQPSEAYRMFERLEEMSAEYTVGDATWALAYLGLGDRARALEWLERAADSTMPDEGFLARFFIRSNLYADPALETADFVDVRNRLGYPE